MKNIIKTTTLLLTLFVFSCSSKNKTELEITSSASSISDKLDIPQDKIIGFLKAATWDINGKLTKSTDAILKQSTFNSLFKKFALSISNGVENKISPLDLAYSYYQYLLVIM